MPPSFPSKKWEIIWCLDLELVCSNKHLICNTLFAPWKCVSFCCQTPERGLDPDSKGWWSTWCGQPSLNETRPKANVALSILSIVPFFPPLPSLDGFVCEETAHESCADIQASPGCRSEGGGPPVQLLYLLLQSEPAKLHVPFVGDQRNFFVRPHSILHALIPHLQGALALFKLSELLKHWRALGN